MVDQALRGACGQPRSCHLDVLQQVTPVLRQTVEETRRICMALRPSTLDDLGLIATLRWFTREFQKTCPGLAIDLDIGLEEATLPEPLKTGIFRIVQEALGNAARHAGARRVEVVLGWDRSVLELTVADDGVGFDPQAKANPAGLGLDAMKEWAGLHDGALRLDTAPGRGTVLTVRWRADEPAA
jgi:signal transduction histidine kinase